MIETYPLETHPFDGEENDYLCQDCKRPRAFHHRYHFKPKADPEHFFTDIPVRYRGAHPRFSPPGRMSNEPMPHISARAKANAKRLRALENERILVWLRLEKTSELGPAADTIGPRTNWQPKRSPKGDKLGGALVNQQQDTAQEG